MAQTSPIWTNAQEDETAKMPKKTARRQSVTHRTILARSNPPFRT